MTELIAGCERVVAVSPHLSMDDDAIRRFAADAPQRLLTLPGWDEPGMLDADDASVVGWLLAYNAVNFCYWPDDGPRWAATVDGRTMGADDEALGVMGAFAAAIRRGVPLGDPEWLEALDAATLGELLAPAPGHGPLPLMPERLVALRELGRGLSAHGGPMGLLRGEPSAAALVERIVAAFPSWSDDRIAPDGEVLRFRKRAQLCVAMIAGRFAAVGSPVRIGGLERLTAFADYRLPQVLRGVGILRLSGDLARRIDAQREVPAGSPEEVALRAAAVVGAERIRRALVVDHPQVDALVVDHLLWRAAVERQDALPPFHRTRTVAY